jgi:hypothetical protein
MESRRQYRAHFFSCIVMIFISLAAVAQNTVTISGNNTVDLEFTKPISPGSSFSQVTNDSKWLNYNITVVPPASFYSITAYIDSGAVPEGIRIQIRAGVCQGSVSGTPGTSTGPVTLSSTPQVIISNIGTCNTGTGLYTGHLISYTISIDNYSAVKAAYGTLNIHYSIQQQQ